MGERKPDGDANVRADDLTWVRRRPMKRQWALQLKRAQLGTTELEIAGLLASLDRIAKGSCAGGAGPQEDHDFRILKGRLQAVVDRSLTSLLFDDPTTHSKRLDEVSRRAGLLISAISNPGDAWADLAKSLAESIESIIDEDACEPCAKRVRLS